MSPKVLTPEQVANRKNVASVPSLDGQFISDEATVELCDSHEELRAERDRFRDALAIIERALFDLKQGQANENYAKYLKWE